MACCEKRCGSAVKQEVKIPRSSPYRERCACVGPRVGGVVPGFARIPADTVMEITAVRCALGDSEGQWTH